MDLSKLIKQTPIIVRDELRKAELLLNAYINDYTHGAEQRPGLREAKTGRLYGGRNRTKKLYSMYGNLQRALNNPSNAGYVFDVRVTSDEVRLLKGADVTKLTANGKRITYDYAAYWENNGRPFLLPAMKKFVKEEMPDVLSNIVNRLKEFL